MPRFWSLRPFSLTRQSRRGRWSPGPLCLECSLWWTHKEGSSVELWLKNTTFRCSPCWLVSWTWNHVVCMRLSNLGRKLVRQTPPPRTGLEMFLFHFKPFFISLVKSGGSDRENEQWIPESEIPGPGKDWWCLPGSCQTVKRKSIPMRLNRTVICGSCEHGSAMRTPAWTMMNFLDPSLRTC